MKITNFLIGIVLSSFIVVSMTLFMSSVSTTYVVDYNTSDYETYNKLSEINIQAEEVKNKQEEITEKSGALDVLGDYFSKGYQAMKLTSSSIDTIDSMADQAIDTADLGASGENLKITIMTIVIILIILGVILSAIVKWGL